MASSESKKLLLLLWKNFILKRRKFGALLAEIILMLVFSIILLTTRHLLSIQKTESLYFFERPVSTVPSFFYISDTRSRPWELAYVPSNSLVVENIVKHVKKDLNNHIKVIGFPSESDFEDYARSTANSRNILAAIVFGHNFTNSSDPLPKKVNYYLRFSNIKKNINSGAFHQGHSWFTKFLFPSLHLVGPRNPNEADGGSPGYITEGFLAVQHALDKAIMLHHSGAAAAALFSDISLFIQRFPYPAYYQDYFYSFANIFIPLTVAFTFFLNHLVLLWSIVWEKENRLKEYQLMIGLRNWMFWTAYFFTFFCLYFINIILMCLVFFVKIKPAPIFQYSDPTLVFVLLLFYAISSIFFSFMISTLFNRVSFAVSLGSFLFFLTYFPSIRMNQSFEHMSPKQKLIWSFDFNVGMAFGFRLLVNADEKKTGLKWSNIFLSMDSNNFLFAYVLGMLLVDALIYGLVAWYIEAVFPGEYGVPKPWNFFMMHSYWFGEPTQQNPEITQFYEGVENKYFEAEPTDLTAGIQIKHLHKVFQENNTTKVAIKDLSLNFYEGQITVLLGHNGAGKSTTLSILSGLYPPTSGEAYVHGEDISQHMDQIRNSLGLCPQQNLLFDHLTVSEHLYFYCRIKGVPQKMYLEETNNMLSAFNLIEEHDAFSKSLSGGMKRKLAIIIALIGGSKVVILDEPTSGMDPLSRRSTWDLLQHYKKDRTILLTTHHMDEADVLGDRIAIMVRGTLRCCGSSVFLKRLYGVGSHLVMVKKPYCDIDGISELIHSYVPTATQKTNVGNELSFILPKEYTHRFEALLTALEENEEKLGISSFGVSFTTMEEVFLRVSNMEDSKSDIEATQLPSVESKGNKNRDVESSMRAGFPTQSEDPTTVFNTGCPLYLQQFHAMFMKRLMYNWRNWSVLLVQILGLVISAFLLLKSHELRYKEIRQMNLDEYGQTIVPFSIWGESNLTTSLLTHLENMLKPGNHQLKKVQGDLLKYLEKNDECIHLCIIAFSIMVAANITIFTVLFNNEAYHSPSLSLAVLDNILFMSLSGADASITVFNKPQPRSQDKEQLGSADGKIVAFKIQLGVALLLSGFCILTVTERLTKAKHMQFLSGVSVLAYWLSALVFDFIIFFISCCFLLAIFKFCKLDIYVMDYHILETMLILMLFGWSAIPLTYLMSFLFSKSASAYIKLLMFYYLSGTFGLLIDTIIEARLSTIMSNFTQTFLLNTLLLFPTYNLGKCISEYSVIYRRKMLCIQQKNVLKYLNCSKEHTKKNIYSLKKPMLGKYLTAMSVAGFVFLLFIFFWENISWKLRMLIHRHTYFGACKKYKQDIISKGLSGTSEDNDVENERREILCHPEKFQKCPVLIKELTKIYCKSPPVLAVKNISLAIQEKECFGLLGFNGAGKTTTFQILTGENIPTAGDVFIDGISITKNILKVRSKIGYCPQFDALLEYLTGWEIMIMYARIWGISEHQIWPYVRKCLNSLDLESDANNLISTYSEGNKRKLSTAIATMGKPSVVFLDEPSTGMDPRARRLLWDTVIKIRESGKAIIITSHSLEECEALCTRISIMVRGKLTCLGSPQYLKNKFGDIYILKTKVKSGEALNEFKNFITLTFPGSELKQENQGILNYYIPSKDNSWGKVFGILEKAKEQYNLEDYSISQVTLDQVFLSFADQDRK
ncbi:phospholipid-transporting ATPase ABCA3-like isoform X1 [Arvicanthis niloticus]|uniref:phospholipid-transporting ATPase ABCA3-like isoform X1 n=2 Tax=Arvicanthis niloticus TaxID=61156 RepID=UPI001486A30F|nr:ATP-binding cassette sub-family A member 3-like [Arvicanthis niloticus]